MTKTLIDIDDSLLARTMEITNSPTKKQAVNSALAEVVRRADAVAYVDLLRTGVVVDLDDPSIVDDAQR